MIHTSLSGEGSRSLSNSSSDLFGLLWAAIGVYYTKNCKLQLLLGSSDLIDSHLRNLGEITGLERVGVGSTRATNCPSSLFLLNRLLMFLLIMI